MAHPEKFTIGRYIREQYMPKEVGGTYRFSFVHPPNSSCKKGGFNRDVQVVEIKANTMKDATTLAEHVGVVCDSCSRSYIPVLPQGGTIFV